MPEARLYRTSPFSIFSSSADVRTSFRSSFRPIWTISSAGISRGVRPMSSSPAYRSFRFTRTNWTSIAVKPRLWMSSIPSRRVRPLQDRGMPEGPKRITRSPNGGWPPLDYYSVRPDISTFVRKRSGKAGRRPWIHPPDGPGLYEPGAKRRTGDGQTDLQRRRQELEGGPDDDHADARPREVTLLREHLPQLWVEAEPRSSRHADL